MEKTTTANWLASVRLYGTVRVLLAVCALLVPRTVIAQDRDEIKAADTSSPRATLKSFIDVCNEIHRVIHAEKYIDRTAPQHAELIARALDCIDMSELPAFAREEHASEVAVCLKEILDRVELPPWVEIPGTEDIEKAGGFEKLSQWRIPGTRITIARVEEGPHRHEYLFSTGTVERAVTYFQHVQSKRYRREGNGPEVSENLYEWYVAVPGHPALAAIVSRLPEQIQRGRTGGLAIWKWPGLLVTLLTTVLLMVVAYRLQASFTCRRGNGLARYWLTILFPIAAMLAPLAFEHVAYNLSDCAGHATLYPELLRHDDGVLCGTHSDFRSQ